MGHVVSAVRNWKETNRYHCLIVGIVAVIFVANILWTDDSLWSSEQDMAFWYNKEATRGIVSGSVFHIGFKAGWENSWPLDSKYWGPSAEVPYRFRLFGTLIGIHTRHLFSREDGVGFYRSCLFWSFIFVAAASIVSFRIGRVLLCNERLSFLAVACLLTAPSIWCLGKYPNDILPNDPLSTLFIAVGILGILGGHFGLSAAITTAGVFCRETVLVVPVFAFFYCRHEASTMRRVLLIGLPFAAWLAFRCLYGGISGPLGYDPFEAGRQNLSHPWESAGFLLCLFGGVWPLVAYGFVKAFKEESTVARFARCALVPVLAVLALYVTCAKIPEMRAMSFTVLPFLVPVAGMAIRDFCRLASRVRKPAFLAWLAYLCGVAFAMSTAYNALATPLSIVQYGIWSERFCVWYAGIPYHFTGKLPVMELMIIHGWVGIGLIHLGVLLALIPAFLWMLGSAALGGKDVLLGGKLESS